VNSEKYWLFVQKLNKWHFHSLRGAFSFARWQLWQWRRHPCAPYSLSQSWSYN